MSRRPNHTLMGIAFIAACLVVAAVMYASLRHSSAPQDNAANSNASDTLNISVAAIEPDDAAPTNAETASAQPSDAKLGNCYGDECSWSRETGRKTVRAGEPGQLVRLSLLGGTSNGDKGVIKWARAPHDVYVFCSKALPAVMMRTDRGWQTDVLTFTSGIPNVIATSAEIYLGTCHPNDGAKVSDNPSEYGYTDIPDDFQDISVTQPVEIFSIASRLNTTAQ